VASPRYPGSEAALPAPLPPETRTVGQLVAEAIRFYGAHFWRSLLLGLPLAADDQIFTGSTRVVALVATFAGAILLTIAYAGAAVLVSLERPGRRQVTTAVAGGFLAYIPFAVLVLAFVLPGVAWLALVGLVVPVAVIERLPLRAAFRRAIELARADYVHALGSLATLAIVFFLTRFVLFFLLRGAGDAADRVAIFLADLVVSPVVFLGAALLYYDQAARAALPRSRRSVRSSAHGR